MDFDKLENVEVVPVSFSRIDDLTEFKISHDFSSNWILYFLEKGEMKYSIQSGGEYTLQEGEILICPPYFNVCKQTVGEISVCIATYESKQLMGRIRLGKVVVHKNQRIMDDLHLLQLNKDVKAYTSVLLLDIWYQIRSLYEDAVLKDFSSSSSSDVSMAIRHIENNLDKKNTLESLANICGYSKSVFIEKFKEYSGMTPGQYIIQLRITKVKKLLLTSMTLKEIAALCGFSNEFYLSTAFHKNVGMSPKDYRKKYR